MNAGGRPREGTGPTDHIAAAETPSNGASVTPEHDGPVRWHADFAAGHELDYFAGYDAGVAAAEAEMAEAWAAQVARVRALARPGGLAAGWQARVGAAERYSRAQAERHWLNPAAWESAAASSMTEEARRKGVTPLFKDVDTLTRAIGPRLPRPRRVRPEAAR